MLTSWAFIYLSPGFDQKHNYLKTSSKSCQFQAIGLNLNHKSDVIKIAQQLVTEGVQTIELCGGFGPEWVSKVSSAINHQIPVGSVMYGPEYRQQLLDIMNFETQ